MTPDRIAELRALADAATPGPWERGDRYHVQGASQCECRPVYGPLITERRMDFNGRTMLAHVHRSDEPRYEPTGINALVNGKPRAVVIETDEYGLMGDADAELIAAARTAIPELLDEVELAAKACVGYRIERDEAEADRDNARAALERVRELAEIYGGQYADRNGAPLISSAQLLHALDGGGE